MPSRYVVRRALINWQPERGAYPLEHAVLLREGEWLTWPPALCGLVPRKGWTVEPSPREATPQTVSCPKCRRRLEKEVPDAVSDV